MLNRKSAAPASAVTPAAVSRTSHFTVTPVLQAFYFDRGLWSHDNDGQPLGALAKLLHSRAGSVVFQPEGSLHVTFNVTWDELKEITRDITENDRKVVRAPSPAAPTRRPRKAAAKPAKGGPTPFAPVVCPPVGTKARRAFEKHVFDCVRDIVDFQQTAAYEQGVRA